MATRGRYVECANGGVSGPMTFGLVHPKIRKWAADQGKELTKGAVRAPIPALGIVKFARDAARERVSHARASFSQ